MLSLEFGGGGSSFGGFEVLEGGEGSGFGRLGVWRVLKFGKGKGKGKGGEWEERERVRN